MKAVLDTHALIWWVDGSKKLTREQSRVIEKAASHGELWVSEVTFLEVALLVDGGRLKLREPVDEWLERATASPAVQRIGITPVVAREVSTLSSTRAWDPADRVIVATARVLGAKLVTSDTRIIEAELAATV